MADIAINPVSRRVQFTGNTGTGPFAFTFNILADEDIAVYKNTTLLTLTTDYTVATSADGTGSVTLVAALVASDVLTIIGGRELERTTDFVTAGDLLAASLNEQLDSLVIMAQQLDEKMTRSFKVNPGDVFTDLEMPLLDDRKGKYLAFNETTGDPEAGPDQTDVVTLAAITQDIATLADIEDGTDATDAIQTVAGISGNVTTVAGISSNVTTVAGISSDVTTVADDATDIGLVSTNISNVNTVAGISANVTTVAGISANITTVATNDANVTTVATNIADVNSFAERYRIGSSDPTTSLDEGDLAFNTTSNKVRVYNGSAWQDVAPVATSITASQISDVTASAAELNTLDGITATTAELNYVDGVTSNVQTQLDAKMTPTYTGDVDITGELIVDSYNETYAAVTSSSNATTVDCHNGNAFSHTLTENTTFTFSNPPASGTAFTFSLEIIQDASASGYTVTWPSSVDWPSATAPTLTATASAKDVFVFYTRDGGTTWYGFTAGQALG